ncbi:hypothetical protein EGW08_006093 [Elysia chlorotica]|uniref:Major facilitator superfamily (MFS) profile domain-containing protein n=1 Tax=Elysia chlorotica TaxID=188477 RepID=A0A433TX92_ELYCH|nr:hypothetical protein EGW08_006093 [Elysia chlorotica]
MRAEGDSQWTSTMHYEELDQMEILLEETGDAGTCKSQDRSKKVMTFRLVLAVTGAALGSFPFGYNMGSVNAPESLIREFIDDTQRRRHGAGFSEHALTTVWALTAAIFAVGGCLGAVTGGWWATTFGRRNGSLLASTLGVVAGCLMTSCRAAESYELIIVGRFIVGIQCGLFTALTPLYLAEISPVRTRGAVGVIHQLALVSGMLTAQVLGFPVLLGTQRSWHVLLGLTAVPSILQALILPFCPHSPRYLLTVKQDRGRCRQALEALRGTSDVEEEMELLERETDSQKQIKLSDISLGARPQYSLLLCRCWMLKQLNSTHLSTHCPQVFFYSTRLFQDAGLTEHSAKYTTSGLGVVMVTMGVLTVPLMDRVGRRTLLLAGLGGMVVMGAAVTVGLALREVVAGFNILSIIFILIFVVFFALGPAPVPWLIVPELFTHDARPAAVSVCVFVNWSGNFLVGFGFPMLQMLIKDFVFLPFTAALVGFFVFVYFKLPETTGKSFREISGMMESTDLLLSKSEVKDQMALTSKESGATSDRKSSLGTLTSDPVAEKDGKGDASTYGSTDHVPLSEKYS